MIKGLFTRVVLVEERALLKRFVTYFSLNQDIASAAYALPISYGLLFFNNSCPLPPFFLSDHHVYVHMSWYYYILSTIFLLSPSFPSFQVKCFCWIDSSMEHS